MTNIRRAPAGLVASGVLAIGLFYACAETYAAPINNEVMLVNAKTGKCATIAGGVSTDNNVESVQFDCDRDLSRRWMLNETTGNIYTIRNVQTGKCLTIAGGVSTDNNVVALQFDCDSHPSRTWRIDDVTGSGINQIRNVQTGKCLTIAGGTSPDNNIRAVQFDCDNDLSRRWTIRLKL
jgi:cytolethal distending toxin subunit A